MSFFDEIRDQIGAAPEGAPSAPTPDAAPAAPRSASPSVGEFVAQVAPAAIEAGRRLGVDPSILIGQWGLETGWGKSVIPGTNNLGNIKDFSGSGIAATDNMTGSRDRYRQYTSINDFGSDYADLIERRYGSAIGAGQDAARYAEALKAGGYAEDPAYVEKMARAAEMVRGAGVGLGEGWNGAPAGATQRGGAVSLEPDSFLASGFEALEQRDRQDAADESPMSTNLSRGWRQMSDSLGNYISLLEGDEAAIVERLQEAQKFDAENPMPTATAKFYQDWTDENYLTAMINVPGFAGGMVEQLANSLPSMIGSIPGMIAGGAMGAAAGPVGVLLGATAGGALGSAPGSVALETGARISAMAGKAGVDVSNPAAFQAWLTENRDAIVAEGMSKGLTVAAMDGVAGGIGSAIIARPALRLQQAERRILERMGINGADDFAVAAARRTPQYQTAIKPFKAEFDVANTAGANAMRGFASFAAESMGEFGGEYAGEVAATGEGNFNEALLEGVMGAGQSAITTGAQFAAQKVIQPNSPLTNAANMATAGAPPAAPGAPAGAAGQGAAADPTARLAELEAITNGTPAQTVMGPNGQPVTIPGAQPRLFTQQEQDEYRALKAQMGGTSPAADQQGAASDPLAQRVSAVASIVEDKALISSLRSDPRFGKESVTDLLAAYAKARNPNLDPLIRTRALDSIDAFMRTFENRPNFTMGGAQAAQGGEQPASSPDLFGQPTLQLEAPAFAERDITPRAPTPELETDQILQARRTADAEYDQAFQDLVKAEQLGASDAELMEYQQALEDAKQARAELDAELEAVQRRIEAGRKQQTAEKRRAILDGILSDPETANPAARFTAELQRQGFTQIVPDSDEMATIQRFEDAREAMATLPAEEAPVQPAQSAQAAKPVQTDGNARQDGNAKPRLTVDQVKQAVTAGANLDGNVLRAPGAEPIALQGPMLAAAREAVRRREAGPALKPVAQGVRDAVESGGLARPNVVSQPQQGGVTNDVPTAESVAQKNEEAGGQEGAATGEGAGIDAVAEQPTQAPTAPEQSRPEPGQRSEPAQPDANDADDTPVGEGDTFQWNARTYQLTKMPEGEGRGGAVEVTVWRDGTITTVNDTEYGFTRAQFEKATGRKLKDVAPDDPAADLQITTALDAAAHEAATSPLNDLPQPTDEQKKAGNYAKGSVRLHGLDISVENPRGSVRSGTAPDGTAWQNTMAHHYGYVKGSLGADGDQIDVFLADGAEDASVAWVIDQKNADGSFDEHKVVIGPNAEAEARAAYLSNYDEGWEGLGAITPMPIEDFKAWALNGKRKRKPLAYVPFGVTTRRIKVDDMPAVEVTLPSGNVYRMNRLTAGESMGLAGWHDMDRDRHSFLGDNQEQAIQALIELEAGQQQARAAEEAAQQGVATAKSKAAIKALGEPPHLNYRVQQTSLNGANILPPVGKKFTDEDRLALVQWLSDAGFSVAARGQTLIHVIGDGAPSIPDGLLEQKVSRIAAEEKARADKVAAETASRAAEYASLPSSVWIESVLGGDEFANAYNKLMLARYLDGKDDFKGLGDGKWYGPLQRLGFDTNRQDIRMDEVLSFLMAAYAAQQQGDAANLVRDDRSWRPMDMAGVEQDAGSSTVNNWRYRGQEFAGTEILPEYPQFYRQDLVDSLPRDVVAYVQEKVRERIDHHSKEFGTPKRPALPAGAIPEPKNWRASYGAAQKYAEALGVNPRGEDGKYLKLPALVAAIEARRGAGSADVSLTNEGKTREPADQSNVAFIKALEDARKELPNGFDIHPERDSISLMENGRHAVNGLSRTAAGVQEAVRLAKQRATDAKDGETLLGLNREGDEVWSRNGDAERRIRRDGKDVIPTSWAARPEEGWVRGFVVDEHTTKNGETRAKQAEMRAWAEREAFNDLAGDSMLSAVANNQDNQDDHFHLAAEQRLRTVIGKRILAAAEANDPSAARAFDLVLADGRPTMPEDFYVGLRKHLIQLAEEAKKAALKAQARDPLAAALQEAGYTPESEDGTKFIQGWEHALDGKTKSTLPNGEPFAAGYAKAQEWMTTPEGKAAASGRRAKKLKNTGADLRRWFDDAKKKAREAQTDVDKLLEQLEAATNRAELLRGVLAEDATPGAVRWFAMVRNIVPTFKDWLGDKSPVSRTNGSWSKDPMKKLRYFITGDADSRMDTSLNGDESERMEHARNFAETYIENVRALAEGLLGVRTVEEGAKRLSELMAKSPQRLEGSWADLDVPDNRTEFGDQMRKFGFVDSSSPAKRKLAQLIWQFGAKRGDNPDTRKWDNGRDGGYPGAYVYQLMIDENKSLESSRKQALTPPRMDRVNRDGDDYRKGQDITPEQFKKTFNFADVGFGQWVGARQDQDHLNYAHDAFRDLAALLNLPPAAISLAGKLHFTIGALGHGKMAAHYQIAHPHPDGGTVPVINVTNTKGDGTVAHEWAHALDLTKQAEGQTPLNRVIDQIKDELRYGYNMKQILASVDGFLLGGSYWKGDKRSSGTDEGRIYGAAKAIDYYAAPSRNKSSYFKEAQALDGSKKSDPYWSNDKEIFARAFEAWVADRLEFNSNYLVNPEWAGEGAVTSETHRGTPYPMGDERKRFNEYFDALAKSLKEVDGRVEIDLVAWEQNRPKYRQEWDAALNELEQGLRERMNALKAQQSAEAEYSRIAVEEAKLIQVGDVVVGRPSFKTGETRYPDRARVLSVKDINYNGWLSIEVEIIEGSRAGEKVREYGHQFEVVERANGETVAESPAAPAPTEPPAPPPAPERSPEPAGELTEADYERLFDEAAAELQEASQEKPEVPPPGAEIQRPQRFSADDVREVIRLIESGEMVLLATRELGVPTIHDFSGSADHIGMGVIRARTPEFEATWTAGGAMYALPSGEAYTTVSVNRGTFPYDRDGILATLRAALPAEQSSAKPEKTEAERAIEAYEALLRGEKIPSENGRRDITIGEFFRPVAKGGKTWAFYQGVSSNLPSDGYVFTKEDAALRAVYEMGFSFDAILATIGEFPSGHRVGQRQQAPAPRPPRKQPAGDTAPALTDDQQQSVARMAADAAKLGVKGIDNALSGLVRLFGGGPGKLMSFPGGFNEETYKQAKPYFEEALQNFQAAGKTIKDLFAFLIQQLGLGVKPYAVQFAKDKQLSANLGEKPSAAMQVADFVAGKLDRGEKFTSRELFDAADKAFGGTQAEGTYSPKDAYDGMEAGVNRWLMSKPGIKGAGSAEAAAAMVQRFKTEILEKLPTQTRRDAEMDEFQQFSTPPSLAYVASWVANVNAEDTMMEPSAGTGDLAVYAKNAGASIVLNELSSRRAEVLRGLFPQARIFTENAEQLNNILPADVRPSVVIMNPPFSATAGRIEGQRKSKNGAAHIEQALKRLAPNGRLVAIMGEGMGYDRPAFRAWYTEIQKTYNVRAVIGIDGREYAKYGTTFDNVILVIDKDGPQRGEVLTGKVDSVEALPAMLENIRESRPQLSAEDRRGQPPSDQQDGPGDPGEDGMGGESDAPAPDGADDVRGGKRGGGRGGRSGGGSGGRGGSSRTGRNRRNGGDSADQGDGRPGGSGSDAGGGTDGQSEGDVTIEDSGGERVEGELTDSIFENYTPQRLKIPGAKKHPGKLVQSAAMAAVEPPAPTYTPNLPKEVIEGGLLSDAQLEAIVYAGQAHTQMLPNGQRRGFFIGDGTGVGKGREIAGIILDNMRQGRKKAVWVSFNQGLINDAKRDFGGVGGNADLIFSQQKTKAGNEIDADGGILFTTYSTLRGGQQAQGGGTQAGRSRLDQIVEWLGEDFDGAIMFDEAHSMGNAVEMKGKRGKKKPSAQALAGVELQARLPKARVVYVSATGATEVNNLAYASRLGLWGEGTPFPNVSQFISQIIGGGVAAMELVARDMKALGMYLARSLSYDGVTYRRLDHELTDLQRDIYNELATAWQVVLNNVNAALEMTNQGGDGKAKSAAMSRFWGTHQRFFNQVITAMMTPSAIDDIQQQLDAGNAVVIQLINTNEAEQERQAAKAKDEDVALEELDFTPRQALMDYVRNAFPVAQFQETTDENGNAVYEMVLDSSGNPVLNQDAVAARDALLENLENIRVPGNPIDEIVQAFGADMVAEVTGRKRRFIREVDEDGNERLVEEKRGASSSQNDAKAFQDDKKKILIFSQAGGTGYSFHADNTAKNKRKRFHYILQPGWRADSAVQGFGRTHRTNQSQEPEYVLMTTDLKAQKRFVSSIARRLDQLGALTRGQRQAGTQGLFSASDNLESKYAEAALETLFNDLSQGRAEGLDFAELRQQMGLDSLVDSTGVLNTSKIPEVPQFLNRLLSLTSDMQDRVFDAFERRLVEAVEYAQQNGTYDNGMATLRAEKVEKKREEQVHADERTGAETRYVELATTNPVRYNTFDEVKRRMAQSSGGGEKSHGWYRRKDTGEVFAFVNLGQRVNGAGQLEYRAAIMRIKNGWQYRPIAQEIEQGFAYVRNARGYQERRDLYERIEDEALARELFEQQVAAAPATETNDVHMITGVILPIWDRMQGHPTIVRTQTDDGERLLGRVVSKKDLKAVLKNLGVGSVAAKMAPADQLARILDGETAILANGWQIKRSLVSGEQRIEVLVRATTPGQQRELVSQGAIQERIQWQERFFIPTGAQAQAVFERIVAAKPVVDLVNPNAKPDGDADADPSVLRATPGAGVDFEPVSLEVAAGVVASIRPTAEEVWKVELRLVPTFDALPQEAKDEIASDYGPDERPKGLLSGDVVYVIADQHDSASDVEATILHEIKGHVGVRRFYGADITRELNKLFLQIGGARGLKQLADERNIDLGDYAAALATSRHSDDVRVRIMMEELLAHLAEAPRFMDRVKAIVGQFRAWLRKMGWVELPKMGQTDLLWILKQADRKLGEPGPDGGPRGGKTPAVKRNGTEAKGAESAAFKKWFGGSRVVDAEGRPLVFYHGGAPNFNGVRDGGRFNGAIFVREGAASGYGDVQYALYVKGPILELDEMAGLLNADGGRAALEKAANRSLDDGEADLLVEALTDGSNYPTGDEIWSLLGAIDEADAQVETQKMRGAVARELGFQAVRTPDEFDGETVMILSPDQVKSATDNNGNYDPAEPSILLRKGGNAMAGRARNKIADLFSGKSAKTFNWWQRTVGSQYGKARADADFGRVYEKAHDFIDDVSEFARSASDKAMGVLPHMDTVGDVVKSLNARRAWSDAKDYQAISDAIFSGTLDNKVWNAGELRARFGLDDKQAALYKQFRDATDFSLETLASSEMARAARAEGMETADPRMSMAEAEAFYVGQVEPLVTAAREVIEGLRLKHRIELEDASGQSEAKRDALIARQARERMAAEGALAKVAKLRDSFTEKSEQIRALQGKGYAPLMRFGQYTVDVVRLDEDGKPAKDDDGEIDRPFFGMFESEAEAREAEKIMRDEYPGYTVSRGVASTESSELYQGMSPEAAEMFARLLGVDVNDAFQTYLRQALNNRSAMKRLIKRKGMAGFANDIPRVLASFIASNARLASSNWHFGEMRKAAAAIPKHKGDVTDEAIKLMSYIQNPQEEAAAMRGFLFFNFLGGSLASAIVNTTQTFSTTLPYLNQFGTAKAAKAIGGAMALGGKAMARGLDVVKDKDLHAALKQAAEDGIIDPQEIHLLMAEARGSGASNVLGTVAGLINESWRTPAARVGRAAMGAWGSFFSMAEKYNRHVAFIAAWDVAKDMTAADFKRIGVADRFEFARRAVIETQFDYSKVSRPNWARGAIGATLFTFKTFLVNWIEFVSRLPSRERALALAVLFLMSGLSGAPGTDDLDDLVDTIGQKLGYNWNNESGRHAWLVDVLGKDGANFVEHGVSAFIPLDVSARLGMGNLIPGTGLLKDSTTTPSREIAEIFGPAGSVFMGAVDAFGNVGSGKGPLETLRPIMPKAINDFRQAYDIATSGEYRDYRGRKVVDADLGDAFIKAIGFHPNVVAEPKRVERMVQQSVALHRTRRAEINELWARGVVEKDAGKVESAREMLRDWNRKNPTTPIRMNPESVKARVRAMRSTSAERLVKASSKDMRGMVANEIAVKD